MYPDRCPLINDGRMVDPLCASQGPNEEQKSNNFNVPQRHASQGPCHVSHNSPSPCPLKQQTQQRQENPIKLLFPIPRNNGQPDVLFFLSTACRPSICRCHDCDTKLPKNDCSLVFKIHRHCLSYPLTAPSNQGRNSTNNDINEGECNEIDPFLSARYAEVSRRHTNTPT